MIQAFSKKSCQEDIWGCSYETAGTSQARSISDGEKNSGEICFTCFIKKKFFLFWLWTWQQRVLAVVMTWQQKIFSINMFHMSRVFARWVLDEHFETVYREGFSKLGNSIDTEIAMKMTFSDNPCPLPCRWKNFADFASWFVDGSFSSNFFVSFTMLRLTGDHLDLYQRTSLRCEG